MKDELPGWKVPNMLLEISGEITPERMKGWTRTGQCYKSSEQNKGPLLLLSSCLGENADMSHYPSSCLCLPVDVPGPL